VGDALGHALGLLIRDHFKQVQQIQAQMKGRAAR
jgi:hypothetical protein